MELFFTKPSSLLSPTLLNCERNILALLMENTQTQLAYLDFDFNFVLVNSAYALASGYSKEELIGRNHFQLFPNQENQSIFEHVRDTGASVHYKAKPFEYVNQPWRGVTYWDWSLIPIINESGKTDGLVFSLTDVTLAIKNRQVLEEHLKQQQELTLELQKTKQVAEARSAELAAVLEGITDAIIIYNIDRKIVNTNLRTVDQLGLNPIGFEIDAFLEKINLRHLDGKTITGQELPCSRSLAENYFNHQYLFFNQIKAENLRVSVTGAPLVLMDKVAGVVTSWRLM